MERSHAPASLAELFGGEYIMIGNDNRDNASFHLDVTISEPALVYLLIDNRLTDGGAGDPPESGAPVTDWTTMTWVIEATNISLLLNGTDVSAALTVAGTPLARTVTYSSLAPNTPYAARMESLWVVHCPGDSSTEILPAGRAVNLAHEPREARLRPGEFTKKSSPSDSKRRFPTAPHS